MTISYLPARAETIAPTMLATFFWASAVTSPFFCKALPPSAKTMRFFILLFYHKMLVLKIDLIYNIWYGYVYIKTQGAFFKGFS